MQADILTSILTELNGTSADIEASAIISIDGLTIATLLQANMDEGRAWSLNSAMLLLGDRGYVLITHAGNEAVLTVLAKPNARLGLIFLDVNRAAQNIAEML
ncbi:roadblock/LC7 domain-containing protein [Methylobacter sp. YRD-M1]|uniref:roadblock/LC7 domain-containing protein n=1 Tax=Methylobacter sp. YRD-M1 TaxID=2911520 RepID=UPI00227AB2B0|nr:hypothetical protein [Methylobacter sp. YRD-M1]WAK03768.1 hypothetical protein LZ558_08280 [Methylobacter sp. YRD-M1]